MCVTYVRCVPNVLNENIMSCFNFAQSNLFKVHSPNHSKMQQPLSPYCTVLLWLKVSSFLSWDSNTCCCHSRTNIITTQLHKLPYTTHLTRSTCVCGISPGNVNAPHQPIHLTTPTWVCGISPEDTGLRNIRLWLGHYIYHIEIMFNTMQRPISWSWDQC